MAAALQPLGSPSPKTRIVRERVSLLDGAVTTVHAAAYDLRHFEPRVALVRSRQLAAYCAQKDIGDAIVGGFFTRPDTQPLGEVRTRGVVRAHTPFDAAFADQRSCLHVTGGRPTIAARNELPQAPRGDLLQAGPLLVRDGEPVYDRALDPEGFSAGAHQFDSDITAERHPRAAIGLTDTHIVALACDGRSRHDAGLTLEELAGLLADVGVHSAMNLDGGGSTTLIAGGRLRNRPRKSFNTPEPGGRAIASAILFERR